MLTLKRFWPLTALLLLALGGCQIPTKTTVNGQEIWIDYRVGVNGKITFTKEEKPSAGYTYLCDYDKEYLEYLGKKYRSHHQHQPGDRRPGSDGGTATFTFRALKPGLTKIIIRHALPRQTYPGTEETINVLIY